MRLTKLFSFKTNLSINRLWLLLVFTAVIFTLGGASLTASAGVLPTGPASGPEPAPLALPVIGVSLSGTGTIMLGDDFSFNVTFDNTGDTGYGPFIDLIFPVNGIDGAGSTSAPRDGFDFVSASYLGITFSGANLHFEYFPDDGGGTRLCGPSLGAE